jgi:hypothetical protein
LVSGRRGHPVSEPLKNSIYQPQQSSSPANAILTITTKINRHSAGMSTLRKQPAFPGLAIHPEEFATPHPQEATSHTWDDILNNTGSGSLTGAFASIDNTA